MLHSTLVAEKSPNICDTRYQLENFLFLSGRAYTSKLQKKISKKTKTDT